MNTAAIILAAGFSSRMGSDKALLELGGMRVLERLVTTYRASGIGRISVVAGRNLDALQQLSLPVTLLHNPHPEAGMFSSVRIGALHLAEEVEAFFVQPVDCPLVTPETLRRLQEALQQQDVDAVVPCCGASKGHPPLLRASLRARIADYQGDDGLRGLLTVCTTALVAVSDQGVLLGMNSPEQYQQLCRYLAEQKGGDHAAGNCRTAPAT